VLTGTLLAAGWLPRVDETTLTEFLAPVKALDLPWLATVSDKQSALIKAVNATWPDLPHQYCQAHYLSNAVTPLYEADEHVKTQLRKQVRAAAGTTMRQVQAKAKQKASDDSPPFIATGLAVRPPDGLDEVKAVARAAQARRGKVTAPPDLVTPAMPAQPVPHPQTVADVRATLQDSHVLVYEYRRNENPPHASALPDGSVARLSSPKSGRSLSPPKSQRQPPPTGNIWWTNWSRHMQLACAASYPAVGANLSGWLAYVSTPIYWHC